MIRKLSITPPRARKTVVYPESDGRPLGETEYHVDATMVLYGMLKRALARRRRIHIACDMFLYYEEGNPQANKAPDVMVTKGVAKKVRRTFKTWIEGAVPCTIFEMVSESTRNEDTGEKMALYAKLGVKEYVLFDPEGTSRLKPPFQAFRLRDNQFERIDLDAEGGFTSTELGLRFVPEGRLLRVFDVRTGERFLFDSETQSDLLQKTLLIEEERRRAEEERLRAEEERLRAEEERHRAEAQKQRAEEEKCRADALQAEVERLQAELRRRTNGK